MSQMACRNLNNLQNEQKLCVDTKLSIVEIENIKLKLAKVILVTDVAPFFIYLWCLLNKAG